MKRKAFIDYLITFCVNFSVIGLGIILLREDTPWQTGVLALTVLFIGAFLAWKKGE